MVGAARREALARNHSHSHARQNSGAIFFTLCATEKGIAPADRLRPLHPFLTVIDPFRAGSGFPRRHVRVFLSGTTKNRTDSTI